MENWHHPSPPPPPQDQWCENGTLWPSRGFILDLEGNGAFLFHFNLSKIEACETISKAVVSIGKLGKDRGGGGGGGKGEALPVWTGCNK